MFQLIISCVHLQKTTVKITALLLILSTVHHIPCLGKGTAKTQTMHEASLKTLNQKLCKEP